jgi:hypothetical protein
MGDLGGGLAGQAAHLGEAGFPVLGGRPGRIHQNGRFQAGPWIGGTGEGGDHAAASAVW